MVYNQSMKKTSGGRRSNRSITPLPYEKQLWEAANTLRGSMDAAEYKYDARFLFYLLKRRL